VLNVSVGRKTNYLALSKNVSDLRALHSIVIGSRWMEFCADAHRTFVSRTLTTRSVSWKIKANVDLRESNLPSRQLVKVLWRKGQCHRVHLKLVGRHLFRSQFNAFA
jgi:hypothetical protein